ncbi:hypothetical protein Dimus_001788, partial [Dionaea muscipula]
PGARVTTTSTLLGARCNGRRIVLAAMETLACPPALSSCSELVTFLTARCPLLLAARQPRARLLAARQLQAGCSRLDNSRQAARGLHHRCDRRPSPSCSSALSCLPTSHA